MKYFCFGIFTSRVRQHCSGEVNNKVESKGSRSRQYIAAVCASITILACAAGQSWPSPAIPHLTSKNSPFLVTDEQVIWIASLYNVGDILGAIVNILFIDRIGRKNSLVLSALPGLIGWCLIIFAKNYIHLYIARLLTGICQGSTMSVIVIYLTEISEKNIRGRLVNVMHILLTGGIFLFTLISAFTSYQTLNISAGSFMLLFLFLFPFLPETPYYYLLRERNEDALKCLMKLRGITVAEKVEVEIREMKLVIEEERKNTKNFAFWELFSKSYNRKGAVIIFCMKATQMMSGVMSLIYYAEEILSHNNLPIKAGVQVAIWHGLALPTTMFNGLILDRLNRRFLFLSSGVITSICLVALGIFFFMVDYLHRDSSSYAWLPLVSLILFQIAYTSGLSSIPYILQAEIFPIRVKGSAVCFGRIIVDVFAFATAAGYKPLSTAFGTYTTFWFFALVTFVGSLISFAISTNTARMSLEEIQANLNPELREKLEMERRNESSRSNCRRR